MWDKPFEIEMLANENGGEDFCFYAKGSRIYYGPKYSTEEAPWRSYTKCTFYGVTSDFEPADDNEMSKFLGF